MATISVGSLETLSLSVVVQGGCSIAGCELRALPRTILQKLLVTSVSQSRILCLRNLITNWPLKHLVLRDCRDFDQPKAVLLAWCLQRVQNDLRLVDLRGCNIGLQGTTTFCKVAANLPVSQNDVSDMRILDTRPSHSELPEFLGVTGHPLVVMLDCVVDDSNFDVVLQAYTSHSMVQLKMSHLTLRELGRRKVCLLLGYLEPDVVSGLDLKMNVLEAMGINDVSSVLLSFTNLTHLNLAYNGLIHRDTAEIQLLANICGSLIKLKKLDLSGNSLRSGVCVILRSLKAPLTHLALSGCGIRDEELGAMNSMSTLANLKSLELCTSGLVNWTELLCSFVLKSAETIEDLSIEENMFTTASVSLLCQMIKQLHLLKRLSLCYNHFLPDDIRAFKDEFPTLEIINRDWLY